MDDVLLLLLLLLGFLLPSLCYIKAKEASGGMLMHYYCFFICMMDVAIGQIIEGKRRQRRVREMVL